MAEAAARQRQWRRGLVAMVVVLGAYTLQRALVLRTGPWDAFLYLENARAIAGGDAGYTLDKPPLLPLLYAPTVSLPWSGAAPHAPLWVVQLQAALLSLLSMAAVQRALSPGLGATLAWAGVLLSMGNVVFVRYAPLVMTDVLGAGLVAVVFAGWMRARRGDGTRAFVVTGVALGCAVALRYQLAVLPFALALAELGCSWKQPRGVGRRLRPGLSAALVAAAVFVGLHALTYAAIGRPVTLDAFLEALDYAAAGARREHAHEAPWHYAAMLPICLSPLVLLGAAAGLFVAARRRRDADLLFAAWLLACVAPLLRVDHNEIRYLYTAFPALIYFALVPVQQLVQRMEAGSLSPRVAAGITLGAPLALLLSIWPGIEQARRDVSDPFFTTDVARAASAWLLETTPPDLPFLWLGFGHATHARDLPRLVHDEFFNVFHIGPHVFEYFTQRRMTQWAELGADPVATAIALRPGGAGVIVGTSVQRNTRELLAAGNPSDGLEALVIEPSGSGRYRVRRRLFPFAR